jgi:hypothetical protein
MSRLSSLAAQQLAELAVALADGERLARGRRYQRRGKVSAVHVGGGAATAEVEGSRPDPYEVTLAVKPANENTRRAVSAGDVVAAVPKPGDVAITCVCPDWGDPCKHGVAALLELAREVDDDPSALLRWRGIDEVVAPPPPGTESLADLADLHPEGSAPTVTASAPDVDGHDDGSERSAGGESRPADGAARDRVLEELRDRLGSRLVSPGDEGLSDGVGDGAHEGAADESRTELDEFFGGSMHDEVAPVARLEQIQLGAFESVRVVVDGHDVAPVVTDAIETIADYWLTR